MLNIFLFNDLAINWVEVSINYEKNSMIFEANHFDTSTYIKLLFFLANSRIWMKKNWLYLIIHSFTSGVKLGVAPCSRFVGESFMLCQHQIFMRDNINLCNFFDKLIHKDMIFCSARMGMWVVYVPLFFFFLKGNCAWNCDVIV